MAERVGLQPGEPVAAAGAAEENRPLVAHELAAAAGENRRTPDIAACCWRRVTSRGGCLGARCEGSRRSRHQPDRRAVDRNRFRCWARLEKEKCLRNGWEKRQFLALRFWRSRRKGSALKNLAGALHTDGGGCTLSVGREVKMEIPVEPFLVSKRKFPASDEVTRVWHQTRLMLHSKFTTV